MQSYSFSSVLRFIHKTFDEKEFDRLFEQAELCNFTAEEYSNYQDSQNMIYDYENTIDFARMQDEAIGLEKGREEERFVIAKTLINLGVPIEQIAQATTLTREQLATLKK